MEKLNILSVKMSLTLLTRTRTRTHTHTHARTHTHTSVTLNKQEGTQLTIVVCRSHSNSAQLSKVGVRRCTGNGEVRVHQT